MKKKMTVRELDELNNVIINILGFTLTILFIVAKLLKWIDVSWWWILVPIILPSCYMCKLDDEEKE